MHQITLGTECHFLSYRIIFDLVDAGFIDEIFDFIGTVVDDDPFHAVSGVGLVFETFEHGGDEGAAVECGGADRYEGVEFLLEFGFMGDGSRHFTRLEILFLYDNYCDL